MRKEVKDHGSRRRVEGDNGLAQGAAAAILEAEAEPGAEVALSISTKAELGGEVALSGSARGVAGAEVALGDSLSSQRGAGPRRQPQLGPARLGVALTGTR